jgi:hypothetical protein
MEMAPWRGQARQTPLLRDQNPIFLPRPPHVASRRGEYGGHLISYFVVINIRS